MHSVAGFFTESGGDSVVTSSLTSTQSLKAPSVKPGLARGLAVTCPMSLLLGIGSAPEALQCLSVQSTLAELAAELIAKEQPTGTRRSAHRGRIQIG